MSRAHVHEWVFVAYEKERGVPVCLFSNGSVRRPYCTRAEQRGTRLALRVVMLRGREADGLGGGGGGGGYSRRGLLSMLTRIVFFPPHSV